MSMTDIKTDPTLAEWIGIHDAILELELRMDRLFETMSTLRDNQKGLIALVQIIADREY